MCFLAGTLTRLLTMQAWLEERLVEGLETTRDGTTRALAEATAADEAIVLALYELKKTFLVSPFLAKRTYQAGKLLELQVQNAATR